MTDTIPVPDVPEENELLDEMREAELEDVLGYIRQCGIDASRFGAPIAVERAFTALAEDLQRGNHR